MSSGRSRSGGRGEREDVQPIVQIGAETAGRDCIGEVQVGRGDDAYVDAVRARAADAFELLLLQHAQQLRLQLEGKVAHLVEKQRAAVGQLEASDALLDGTGKGAALVTEELALQQAGRDRGTVHLHEGALAASAEIVDGARDQLLAGAGLAEDQHGRIGRRHRAHLV
jgi:hypothetical protein